MLQWLACVALAAHAALHIAHLRARLRRKDEEVAVLAKERHNERLGRTRAERELRELQLRQSASAPRQGGADAGGIAEGARIMSAAALDFTQVPFPLRAIGVLRSCFSRRNGTPRQPLLVPAARATLTLRPDLSAEFLEGLAQFSHCWVLYVFHENTDLQRLWQADSSGVRSKIRVPRLDGARLGVFATRSPHRPCPIGLSVAEVVAVKGNTLTLGGADIVDGSPVLDIKPYVKFCDSVPAALAPPWVAPAAEDEPLSIASVNLPPAAAEALERSWRRRGRASLFPSYPAFRDFVLQVLSRDIRSVTQRVKVPGRRQRGVDLPDLAAAAAVEGEAQQEGGAAGEGKWHVVLDGVDISYEVDERNSVTIMSAAACVKT